GTYDELESDLLRRMEGLSNQIAMTEDKRSTIIQVNRIAKTATDVFDDILHKPKLERNDLELIIDRMRIFEDHIEIQLKADIDSILKSGALPDAEMGTAANFNPGIVDSLQTRIVQSSINRLDKVYDVNVISNGEGFRIHSYM
ncbi:MAG: stage V sporulation protein T, partial [Oscillospiraceae bacterium]